MEMDNRYATNGKGNLAVTLGAAGLGAALLGGNGLSGLLGGGCGCGANVTRYDAEKDAKIASLETEVKLRDASVFTLGEVEKLRNHIEGKLDAINNQLCAQAVVNAQVTANISCMQTSIAALNALTKTVIPIDSICPTPAVATTT